MIRRLKLCILRGRKRRTNDSVPKQQAFLSPAQRESSSSPLTELPSELKQRVASFLSVHEALKLTETSKSIRCDLDMRVVSSPLTDRGASQEKAFATYYTQQYFATVVPNQESFLTHSMSLCWSFCCDFIKEACDGITLYIREHTALPAANQGHHHNLKKMPFFRGRVVVTKGGYYGDDEQERRNVLLFHPKPNKSYQFWIQTAGPNFQVRLRNMSLYRISFGAANPILDYTAYQYDGKVQHVRYDIMNPTTRWH